MRSSVRIPVTLAALLLAAEVRAQSLAPAPATPSAPKPDAPAALAASSPSASTSAPAPVQARRTRAISSEAAAALAATAPKYAPPPPPPPKKSEEELPDLRETDKPKNEIIRLPKYIVREPRPPVFRERDIHTQEGLAELARKRYLTETDRVLNRWTLFSYSLGPTGATARALDMYAEDERLKNMSDMADRANMVDKSDSAAGVYIKREVDKTFIRAGDFGYQSAMRPH